MRPKSSALRVLQGNPGKRPLNKREPHPGPLPHECPDVLTEPTARAEWDRLVPHLIAIGVVTMADRAVLVGYCAAWAQWLRLYENDDVDRAHKAFTHLVRAAVELGLTPSSRSRVHAMAPGKANTWQDVLP
jgi:phage terminase small subunit